MFRVVSQPINRSTYNFIYSIWYLLNRYCYLPLLWKSWNWFECDAGIFLFCFWVVADLRQQPHWNRSIQFPHHTPTSSNTSTIAVSSSNDLTSTRYCKLVVCYPDDGWRYHPKHVETFSRNELYNVASRWKYIKKKN